MIYSSQESVRGFPIALLATPGGLPLARVVDQHLQQVVKENGEQAPDTFIRQAEIPRFQNGEGKGIIQESIRGTDLYIFVDIGNYGVTYKLYDWECPMSPDEHFQDLKRLLGAAKSMAQRTVVVMPLLYSSRQHKQRGRESLDCALALQEITNMGVRAIMTIDAHNSHVINAIPMCGIENLHGTYTLIADFIEAVRGQFPIDAEHLVVCSPDLGGMERARYFAEHFRVPLTGFYKVRDLTRVVDGKNPIIEHKFLGSDIKGKHVLVVDDMLASGGSMIDVCRLVRKLGAEGVYLMVTYALFSSGLAGFDQAYEEGLFDRLFATNATYIPPTLQQREWFIEVDITRFIAKFIYTFNRDRSITQLLDSTEAINRLLGGKLPPRWDGTAPLGSGRPQTDAAAG